MEWFLKLIEAIDTLGFGTVMSALIIVIILFAMYTVWHWVRSGGFTDLIRKQQEEREKKASHARLFANSKISELLLRLLVETYGDRASILEMHNGKDNPKGLPFLYLDMTYERKRDGVPSLVDECHDLNLSHFEMSNYLFENRFFIGTVEELRHIDSYFVDRLCKNDIKYLAIIMINTDSEIGFLQVHYSDKPKISKQKIHAKMGDYIQKIAVLLDYNKK